MDACSSSFLLAAYRMLRKKGNEKKGRPLRQQMCFAAAATPLCVHQKTTSAAVVYINFIAIENQRIFRKYPAIPLHRTHCYVPCFPSALFKSTFLH